MLSGLLIVLLPLFLGYLVRVRSTRLLNLINRAVSGSVYLILLFMGVSLAGLENLGSQLSRLGGNALLLFSITTLCCSIASASSSLGLAGAGSSLGRDPLGRHEYNHDDEEWIR